MLTFTLVSVALAGVLTLVVTFFDRRRRRKRALWLQAFAKVIGLNFLENSAPPCIKELSDFVPFAPKMAGRFENTLIGTLNGVSIEVFDYFFAEDVTFLQPNNPQRRQTIIHFTSKKLQLPYFALRPKNIIDRSHPRFGEAFIRLKQDMEFFQTYIIQTDDETAVRALFDEELCNHFAHLLTKSVEGKGNQLLYYYEGHLISHERIDEFLEEAMQVFNLVVAKSKVQAVLNVSFAQSEAIS